jgi:hypothetical protein
MDDMSNPAHALTTLFETIKGRIEQQDMIPLQTICLIAGDITDWTHKNDIKALDTRSCGIFGQVMSSVSRGMTGTTHDAQQAITHLKASLPHFSKAVSKIAKSQLAECA